MILDRDHPLMPDVICMLPPHIAEGASGYNFATDDPRLRQSTDSGLGIEAKFWTNGLSTNCIAPLKSQIHYSLFSPGFIYLNGKWGSEPLHATLAMKLRVLSADAGGRSIVMTCSAVNRFLAISTSLDPA